MKNILIIMPKFYSYQSQMKADLESRGAYVKFYDEEPEKSKFLILKNIEKIFRIKNIFVGFNKKLAQRIIAEQPAGGYDELLVIRGNVLTADTIKNIKEKALKPGARTVYYAWDSFENMRHKGELGRVFDYRATFDSVDAKNDPDYELLPLFYSDDFDAEKLQQPSEYKYDYVSVSAFFPFRYKYFKAFKEANPDKKLCLKIYMAPSVYRGKKLTDPKLVKELDMDIVSFKPFSPTEIRDMVLQSRAVLDLAHEQQQGLTMRTMETLGIKRKLITNNCHLKEYEFYHENNDYIWDGKDFVLPGKEWLDKPYAEDDNIRKKYSIHAWLSKLLDEPSR